MPKPKSKENVSEDESDHRAPLKIPGKKVKDKGEKKQNTGLWSGYYNDVSTNMDSAFAIHFSIKPHRLCR